MKKYMLVAVPLLAIVCCSVVVAQKKGKTRPLTTHQLMEALVGQSCKGIGAGLKKGPTSDDDWKALATKAALLNESGYIMMADGRCPDATWAGANKTLRECSEVLLKKIEEKDADGAQEAFTAMTKSCGACHKAHKKKK